MMKTPNSFRRFSVSTAALTSAALATVFFLAGASYAQDGVDGGGMMGEPNAGQDGGTNPIAVSGAGVYVAEENAIARLPGVLARGGGPAAVSLRASGEAFDANPAARDALLAWVKRGGVVFLHTGAARAFGFLTVEARAGTNQIAGQLFGRAHAALPFGSHPLLMAGGQTLGLAAPETRANVDLTQLPGVNTVFYEMQPGDHLVESHPAGTPLLEVADLAVNANTPLYASAIAPFGNGLAVFTPDSIDQTHGDGALFARNLLTLTASGRGGRSLSPLVSVAAKAIENGAPLELSQALANALTVPAAPALPALGTLDAPATGNGTGNGRGNGTPENATARQNRLLGVAPIIRTPVAPPAAPAAPATPAGGDANGANGDGVADAGAVGADDAANAAPLDEPGLLIPRAEAASYASLMSAGGQSATIATNLLQARLFISRGDGPSATRSLDAIDAISPNSAEVALGRGLLLAGASQELNQPSPVRANQVNEAARLFSTAAQANSILPVINTGAATRTGAGAVLNRTVAGISTETLGGLSERLTQIAQVFALEPPLVQQFGVGDAAITVRAIDTDPALRLIVPGAQALANASNFGWRGDREEILLFPTAETFAAYRQALGINGPSIPLPAGAAGDVVGQRMIINALPSIPIVQRNPATGTNRVISNGSSVANVLGRLHSYVLLNALDEGGSNVPAWLRLGIENVVNSVILADPQFGLGGQGLAQVAQAGGLLTPDQFSMGAEQNGIAQAQAAAIVSYFYAEHGAGAVVETLQRLGTGQTIDEALQATTQGDQMALFQNWRANQFGPGQLPNQG